MEFMKAVRLIEGNKEDSQTPVDPARWRRRAGFSFPVFRPLGVACALRFSLGCALALLGLAVSDASAQQITSHNPDKDIVTSGIGLGNKNPRGIWVDEKEEVLLVLDFRYRKIFTYCFDTGRRLDNHTNDKVNATKKDRERENREKADSEIADTEKFVINEDDFFLFNTNAPIVLKSGMPAAVSNLYPGALTAADSKRFYPYQENNNLLLPNPYGIWANGTTNGSTLWVSDFDDDKIYAYDLTWHQSPIDSSKKYAKGTRASGKDVKLLERGVEEGIKPNDNPHGIWVNSSTTNKTMYVVDNGRWRVYAYDYNNGKYERTVDSAEKDIWRQGTAKDPNFDENDLKGIQGVWSDGTTIWISSFAGNNPGDIKKIYAYNVDTFRDTAKDFNKLSNVGNDRPRGIWSNGETMWVADQTDNKLYAYHAFRSTTSRNDKQDFETLKARRKPKF